MNSFTQININIQFLYPYLVLAADAFLEIDTVLSIDKLFSQINTSRVPKF